MSAKKNIIEGFEESGLGYGDFVSHKELDRWAGLSFPRLEELRSQTELQQAMKEYSLQRLSAIDGLKDYALTEKQMFLQSVHREGYRIVHPREQTDAAITAGMRQIHKGLKAAERGILNVNKAMLTGDERAYNSSVSSRLQGLKLMMGRRKDLLTKS